MKLKLLKRWWPALMGWVLGCAIVAVLRGDFWFAASYAAMLLGSILNVLVMSANGWQMPVHPSFPLEEADLAHVTLAPHHRYPYLADRIHVGPFWLSVGDVCMVAALVLPAAGLV